MIRFQDRFQDQHLDRAVLTTLPGVPPQASRVRCDFWYREGYPAHIPLSRVRRKNVWITWSLRGSYFGSPTKKSRPSASRHSLSPDAPKAYVWPCHKPRFTNMVNLSGFSFDMCRRKAHPSWWVHSVVRIGWSMCCRVDLFICAPNLCGGDEDLRPVAQSPHPYLAVISCLLQSTEQSGNFQLT